MDWLKIFSRKKSIPEPHSQPTQKADEPTDQLEDSEMEKLLGSFMRTCWPSSYGEFSLGVDTHALKELKGPYLEKAKTAILKSLEKKLSINPIIAASAIEMTEAIPIMIRWIKHIRSRDDKNQSSPAYGRLAHALYNFTKDGAYLTDLTEAARVSGFDDITGSDAILSLWRVPLNIDAFSAVWEKLKRGKAIRESSSWRDVCEDFLRAKIDDPIGKAFLNTLSDIEQKEIQSIVATTRMERIERNRRFEKFVVERYNKADLNKYGEYTKVGGSPIPGLTLRCILEGHAKKVNSTSWSPDSLHLASAGDDNLVVIWDVEKGEFVSIIEGGEIDRSRLTDGNDSDYRISQVAWSADKEWIAFGSEKKNVSIWNVKNETFLVPPKREGSAVRNLAWAPGHDTLLYSYNDNTVWIRDVPSGEVRQIFQGYNGLIYALAWSSDAAFIAAGYWNRDESGNPKRGAEGAQSEIEILLWDVKNEKVVTRVVGPNRYVSHLSWMPNQPILAAASADGTISIWNMQERRQIASLESHMSKVESVSFSAGGILLASTAERDEMVGGTVRLWRTDTWEELFVLKELESAEDTLAFHSTLPILATRCHGNPAKNTWNSKASFIRIWDLDFETFLKNPPFIEAFNRMETDLRKPE